VRHAVDLVLGRSDPACDGNVGSRRVCKHEQVGATPFDPYSYLATGLTAMTSRAQQEYGPQMQQQMQQGQQKMQQGTAVAQQKIDEAKALLDAAKQERAKTEAAAAIERQKLQDWYDQQGLLAKLQIRVTCFFKGQKCPPYRASELP